MTKPTQTTKSKKKTTKSKKTSTSKKTNRPKKTARSPKSESQPTFFDAPTDNGLETIVVDANQLYEFLALGVVTTPRHRNWRRWRTFLGNDGDWRGLGSADGAVPAVNETGKPVVLSFESPPSDASGVLPVCRLKSVSVSSQEEMDDLDPRLRKDDFFPISAGVTVDSDLAIDRMEEASTPEVDAELSHRLGRADRVVGGLAGLLALFDGSKDVLSVFAPFVADQEASSPRGDAADSMIFAEELGRLFDLSGDEITALLSALQAHYVDGALDRSASLPAICDSLAGRSKLDGWRGLIEEIFAGNSEAKASMVADPEAEGDDLLLRVLALILVRLPSQMTVDDLVVAASNTDFPIGRRVACVAAGIVGWCQGLEAQRTVKQGAFRDLICGLLADGIAARPGLWSRARLAESESKHEQKLILTEDGAEIVSAKTAVPLFWERPLAQIRDWAHRHGDRHPDETVQYRFDKGCVEVSTDEANYTVEVEDRAGRLKEISILASVDFAKKKKLKLTHWKALNDLQMASRCRVFVDSESPKRCLFKVSQLQDTWDQHEVDWAFDVLSDAVRALWKSEILAPEMKKRESP